MNHHHQSGLISKAAIAQRRSANYYSITRARFILLPLAFILLWFAGNQIYELREHLLLKLVDPATACRNTVLTTSIEHGSIQFSAAANGVALNRRKQLQLVKLQKQGAGLNPNSDEEEEEEKQRTNGKSGGANNYNKRLQQHHMGELEEDSSSNDPSCNGRRIYIYPLPKDFNQALVDKCLGGYGEYCTKWHCVPCDRLQHQGFGPLVPKSNISNILQDHDIDGNNTISQTLKELNKDIEQVNLVPRRSWYRTDQFSLEVIFHERLKVYKCLTKDATIADAIYIPFYAGLEAGFTLFSSHTHLRDELTQRLLGWLSGNEVWQRQHNTTRHFIILGRIAWDFDRDPFDSGPFQWGSSLLRRPEFLNVTRMVFEKKFANHEIGVPYPTLFHPSSKEDIHLWQEKMKKMKRPWLVTFVGASSRHFDKEVMRQLRLELARQCKLEGNRDKCRAVECGGGHKSDEDKQRELQVPCGEEPESVVRALARSTYCLQPRGDSATRKGFFDSIVAGCVPVVFATSTAHDQYVAHLDLPKNATSPQHLAATLNEFSVLITEDDVLHGHVDVIQTLEAISESRLRAMQHAVRQLIPRIVYSMPSADAPEPDAFSIALDALFASSQSVTQNVLQ